MAQVIQFTPRRTSPSGLMRAARKRSGVTPEQWASLLGHAIGRPQLSPGTIRAWESGTIPPPVEVLKAAPQLAQAAPSAPQPDGWPARPGFVDARPPGASPAAQTTAQDVMQAFRDADGQVGGGYVYGAVIRYLERGIAPHLFTGTGDVFSAAAALTE